MDMTIYQNQAKVTAIYPDTYQIAYPILGLANEAGELAGAYKKVLRDNNGDITPETKKKLIDELGDVLWYTAVVAHDLGIDLSQVAIRNLNKLADRKERGVLQGSGDTR